jgi:hypothetical protein
MRPLAALSCLSLLLGALVACDDVVSDPVGDSGLDDSGLSDPTGDDDRPGRPGGDGAAWTRSAHPCFGNRTDAMWFDDRDTVWVGCGSTTEGTGLFRSDDGGATWRSADPFFADFRVSSIQRAADGALYVAGTDTASAARVAAIGADGAISVVHAAGSLAATTFHVGTFRRSPAGLMVAESLTGAGLLVGEAPGAFQDASGWAAGAGSFQILDLAVHGDAFYGVGSTISQPPYVYLPPAGGQTAADFRFEILELSAGPMPFDGELWGLAVDDGGVLVGGVDQDHDVGWVFWTGADPWAGVDGVQVSALLGTDDPTWVRGVCKEGATLVAVGEYSRRGEGLVIRSDDGGATWSDVTPDSAPPVSKCALFDGELVITGAEGLFAAHPGR